MKLTVIIVALIAMNLSSFSQSNTEQEIKKIVMAETEAYIAADSVKWASMFVHNDKLFRAYTTSGYHSTQTGWKNIGPPIIAYMKEGPFYKTPRKVIHDKFVFQNSPNQVWMSYEQKMYRAGVDSLPTSISLETRTLVRENGAWKISAIGTIDSLSYSSTSAAIMENNFNDAGYRYMAAKNHKEAIEVFKLNVTLFPNSWNAYDSLGEAYAADGNKELAIKNYERSVELNPKSEAGIETLKKLKAQ